MIKHGERVTTELMTVTSNKSVNKKQEKGRGQRYCLFKNAYVFS